MLTAGAATKQRFLALLPDRRIVHLATHGDYVPLQEDAYSVHDLSAQLDSALVLSGANADPTGIDSLLTAEEIGRLDLRHVELLVMSACESALGHVRAGQGIEGLFGALDRAQVGSAVGALWKVDDRATAELMKRFYGYLFDGPDRGNVALALRRAQTDLAKAAGTEHPYFWAAWTVMGYPGQANGATRGQKPAAVTAEPAR
jgi:CHAT domain-containing protein